MINRLVFRLVERRADRLIAEAAAYSRTKGDWNVDKQRALNSRRDHALHTLRVWA